MYGELEEDSVELVKAFAVSKMDDGAVVVEAVALLSFLATRGRITDTERVSICIR